MNTSESAYLALLAEVLCEPQKVGDLTLPMSKSGSRAIFNKMLTFPLMHAGEPVLPLFTTKRVFYRGVVEELAWFLRGSTDAKELANKGVHIWDANGSLEYLRSRNLPYREGLLGPIYGFQWRYFGAGYGEDGKPIYLDGVKCVDQVEQVVTSLKTNPFSRAHILNAWNPTQLHMMALPPCHTEYSWQVAPTDDGRKMIFGALKMRSSDLFLGLPFNVASLAIFTHLLATHTSMVPGSITLKLDDAHLYDAHREAASIQITREPRVYPTFHINGVPDLWKLSMSDFTLGEYTPHPKLDAPLIVMPTSNFST